MPRCVGNPTDNSAPNTHIHATSAGAVAGRQGTPTAVIGPTDRAKGTGLNIDGVERPLNHLLALLPRPEMERLAPIVQVVTLEQGIVLNEPGDEPERVWFPHTGMVSLLAVMSDGKAVET